MPNPFMNRETISGESLLTRHVLAFVGGAERRRSIWLDSSLATADAAGNKYYEKGQVLSKRATGKWSYVSTALLATAYSPDNPDVCVLVQRVNVGFGDGEGAGYFSDCQFDKAALIGYTGNE